MQNYNKEEVMKSLCKYFDWDEDSEQASSISTALDSAYKAGEEKARSPKEGMVLHTQEHQIGIKCPRCVEDDIAFQLSLK